MSFQSKIRRSIEDARGYVDDAPRVLKRAKREVQLAMNELETWRLEALARVAKKFIFLQSPLEDIMDGLKNESALDTAIQDLCGAIVKIAANLAYVAELLDVVQDIRQEQFYAKGAVDLVKEHFTETRTIELMRTENTKMIETLPKKSQGSAANDASDDKTQQSQGSAADNGSDDKTQLGDCDATGDKLAKTYHKLQNTIEKGQQLDTEATQHVLDWGILAVEEANEYSAKHGLSLHLLVEYMFIKAVDERYTRGWIDDLKQDLQKIAAGSMRVHEVMEMVSTLEKACKGGPQEYTQFFDQEEPKDSDDEEESQVLGRGQIGCRI